jgi:hypothetical protein
VGGVAGRGTPPVERLPVGAQRAQLVRVGRAILRALGERGARGSTRLIAA